MPCIYTKDRGLYVSSVYFGGKHWHTHKQSHTTNETFFWMTWTKHCSKLFCPCLLGASFFLSGECYCILHFLHSLLVILAKLTFAGRHFFCHSHSHSIKICLFICILYHMEIILQLGTRQWVIYSCMCNIVIWYWLWNGFCTPHTPLTSLLFLTFTGRLFTHIGNIHK